MEIIAFMALAVSVLIIIYARRNRKYASVDNLRGPESNGFLMGNLAQMYAPNSWKFHDDLEARYASVVKVHGMLGGRQVYVFDPKSVHRILKDTDTYQATRLFLQGNRMLFGMGLLSTVGDHHKAQRRMINPVFSVDNLRRMLPIFLDVAQDLKNILQDHVAAGEQEIDVLGWMNRTALEIIGQAGLGHSFKSLQDGPSSPYSHAVMNLIPTLFSMFAVRQCFVSILELGPAKWRGSVVRLIPWPKLQRLCRMVDVMDTMTNEVYVTKKRAVEDNTISEHTGKGCDIMTILLRANIKASVPNRLPERDILGQMSTLTFAAIDTTSGALSRILHLLAQHQDVQHTLRTEILKAQQKSIGTSPTYDDLMNLPYLDAVCRETLRLFPPLPFVTRTTRQDTTLPLTSPLTGRDGSLISEISIPRNTNVVLGIMASNRNPDIWGADATVWNPDRWSRLPETVIQGRLPGVYSHMLTFLGGSKGCIGFKFSEMEIKTVIYTILPSFRFSVPETEIEWYMSGVQKPGLRGQAGHSLPLKVTLI